MGEDSALDHGYESDPTSAGARGNQCSLIQQSIRAWVDDSQELIPSYFFDESATKRFQSTDNKTNVEARPITSVSSLVNLSRAEAEAAPHADIFLPIAGRRALSLPTDAFHRLTPVEKYNAIAPSLTLPDLARPSRHADVLSPLDARTDVGSVVPKCEVSQTRSAKNSAPPEATIRKNSNSLSTENLIKKERAVNQFLVVFVGISAVCVTPILIFQLAAHAAATKHFQQIQTLRADFVRRSNTINSPLSGIHNDGLLQAE